MAAHRARPLRSVTDTAASLGIRRDIDMTDIIIRNASVLDGSGTLALRKMTLRW